eukprot:NODE_5026_length_1078_cov_43.672251_g4471_i0.p2 GENE.NODE_5026_length_1078_cov_43.672251_g4471_i0~~NODE_5026_length_1078_cov_43.672251_g4471_i0.p2  ORF type:complete len:146 (-),score=23.99 NODE_5026_length_1078_cov_43.672251_g4471_i0:147-584(-)
MTTYLNRADVQKALNAEPTQWQMCGFLNPNVIYNVELKSMIPLYQKYIANTNYKILHYSGDADTIVNFVGTETWIESLNRPVTKVHQGWYYPQEWPKAGGKQLGGWRQVWDRIAFVTVKGAGHMVPMDQPAPALQLLKDYLSGAV